MHFESFGRIWEERGLLNSKGKGLVHEKLILEVLETLWLPEEVAVAYVKRHQKGVTLEAQKNNLVDLEAKDVAESGMEKLSMVITPMGEMQEVPVFSEMKERELLRTGAMKDNEGKWRLLDGRQLLNKPRARKTLEGMHGTTQWGTQALSNQLLRDWGCRGIFGIAKQVTEQCVMCQQVNRKVRRKTPRGGWELALQPFQNIQVDFTELPQVQRWKFLLVIVDHLTLLVEVVATVKANASIVSKTLLESIIPWYGMVNGIDSDQGTHFTSKILQQVVQALGVWDLHTPWHPQVVLKGWIKLLKELRLIWWLKLKCHG